jgi:hypothetical protein
MNIHKNARLTPIGRERLVAAVHLLADNHSKITDMADLMSTMY